MKPRTISRGSIVPPCRPLPDFHRKYLLCFIPWSMYICLLLLVISDTHRLTRHIKIVRSGFGFKIYPSARWLFSSTTWLNPSSATLGMKVHRHHHHHSVFSSGHFISIEELSRVSKSLPRPINKCY